MEGLPSDLYLKIFSSLDYKNLATAHLGRKWRELALEDKLWCDLFKDRWGINRLAKGYDPKDSKSWKDEYIVRDRIYRVGRGLQVIREGDEFFVVHDGQIISEC